MIRSFSHARLFNRRCFFSGWHLLNSVNFAAMHFHVCGLNSLNSPSFKSVRHSFTSFKSEDMPVNQIWKESTKCCPTVKIWNYCDLSREEKRAMTNDHQIFCHSWLAALAEDKMLMMSSHADQLHGKAWTDSSSTRRASSFSSKPFRVMP